MRLHPIALTATAALCAGTVFAQGRAARFDERDANGDGLLSQQEYTSTGGHPGNFRALDGNGDGVLTRDEFVGGSGASEDQGYYKGDRGYSKADRYPDTQYPSDPNVLTKQPPLRKGAGYSTPLNNFRLKDSNRDGMLSRVEYGEQRTFDRVDRNDDGWISADEYQNPPPAPGPGSTEYEFLVRDANRDGMISAAEMRDNRTFSRADGNGDGLVSYDEFLNSRGARRRH